MDDGARSNKMGYSHGWRGEVAYFQNVGLNAMASAETGGMINVDTLILGP